MKVYSLEKSVKLYGSIDEIWEYFSTPLNLNELTPPDMSFEILTDLEGKKMYPGMIINYKVRPLLNIPLRWTTEITHCETHKYFVDEQRFGPYAFWHHQHIFEQKDDHILMTDLVHYAIPFGILGRLANAVFVKQKLIHIFEFRNKKVKETFDKKG